MAKKTKKTVSVKEMSEACCADCRSKKCCHENKAIGLALGLLLSGVHLAWLILVLVGLAKPLMDWVLGLHMMKLSYMITPFDFWKAVSLLILTFVVGYILGYILAGLLKMARSQR